ncbi:MAG TPA: DUF1931 family protein [Rubrobacteraceae bacterium]|nr:DUF1931 family protein [Rubrobacteraceae bacterium]
MPIGVSNFERFFRAAASLDVDKDDLRRYEDFVNRKVRDLLLISRAAARANGRDIIEPWDLPITKGLQETIHDFREMDEAAEVRPMLEQIVAIPPQELAYSEETEGRLPEIAGGLSLALARAFKIIEPRLKNPQTEHWERAYRVFDLLL